MRSQSDTFRTCRVPLSLEEQLVLDLARPPGTLSAQHLDHRLSVGLDWNHLLELVHRHRTLPLLYWHLKADAGATMPMAIMETLQQEVYALALNNQRLVATLLRLLGQFEAQGIDILPWKGPVLAVAAYDNLLLRVYTDLDLLVRPEQLETAVDMLCANGYRLLYTLAKRKTQRRYFHAYTLHHEAGAGDVDLHWRITKHHFFPFPLEMQGLWDRAGWVTLHGTPVQSLSPEDRLLLLCVHGTVHRWSHLGWLSDIAAMVHRYPNLDWIGLLAQSRRLHSERMLLLGLSLSADLLGSVLPEVVQQRLQAAPIIGRLQAQVGSWLFADRITWQLYVAQYGFPARTLDRRTDRLRYWYRSLRWSAKTRLTTDVQTRLWRLRYRNHLRAIPK